MSSIQKERKLNRLKEYDYSKNGYYFITLCTKDGIGYFGKIENGEMILNQIGETAERCWREIPSHYDKVEIDQFVVMPNHIHGIISINDDNDIRTEQCSVPTSTTNTERRYGLLSKIIKSFKNVVIKDIHEKFSDNKFK